MNDFEMFLTLPAITRRRIIRQAREVAMLTHHRMDYLTTASVMTVTEYDRMRARQDEKFARQEITRQKWG
jgi:hypothetical protein